MGILDSPVTAADVRDAMDRLLAAPAFPVCQPHIVHPRFNGFRLARPDETPEWAICGNCGQSLPLVRAI